jgi:hypothetical protein
MALSFLLIMINLEWWASLAMIDWIRNLINNAFYFYIDYENAFFYYQGDELGMVNPRFNSIDEYQDLETRNKYINLKK